MDAPDYNPFPTGSSVDVLWTGEKIWYAANVTDTRMALHKIKGAKVPCREVYCVYELDNHEQWHSLHNNKIRATTGVLAGLEAVVPVEKSFFSPSGDAASVVTEESTSNESSERSAPSSTESTISAPSVTSGTSVGQPRDFSGFADGTTTAYNSVEKWVVAALLKVGKEKTAIVLPSSMEPNDVLCSQLHSNTQ
jgi:hypothetical protein